MTERDSRTTRGSPSKIGRDALAEPRETPAGVVWYPPIGEVLPTPGWKPGAWGGRRFADRGGGALHVRATGKPSGLTVWLHRNRINRLMIAGIRTEQCCETTARHASDEGWPVDFITEAMLTCRSGRSLPARRNSPPPTRLTGC